MVIYAMKILHISFSDSQGGAAIASYRIHSSLLKKNINSEMLVVKKNTKDPSVHSLSRNQAFLVRLLNKISRVLLRFLRTNNYNLHSLNIFPSSILNKINKINPDIVHIHWIGSETISIKQLSRINIPLVFTLHDMWLFSGSEHYVDRFLDSSELKMGYVYNLRKIIDWDCIIFNLKKKYLLKKNFFIITPSQWMNSLAKKSFLLNDKRCEVIGNPLNMDIFYPRSRKNCRLFWKLPMDKKIILFGALSSTQDKRKGFYLLRDAINLIYNQLKSDVLFVIFGSDNDQIELNVNYISVGTIFDPVKLSMLYSAADVMVTPSLIEAFGQTASESIASGTPVVGFANTGLEDIITSGTTGVLVKNIDYNSLAESILFVLANKEKFCFKKSNSEQFKFSDKIIANQYINFYKSIV